MRISDEIKHIQFGMLSISYNCLPEISRNETHCRRYFIAAILTEMDFISCDKMLCKHYPKWNHPKGNIWACDYFIKTKIVDRKIKTEMTFIPFFISSFFFTSNRNIISGLLPSFMFCFRTLSEKFRRYFWTKCLENFKYFLGEKSLDELICSTLTILGVFNNFRFWFQSEIISSFFGLFTKFW